MKDLKTGLIILGAVFLIGFIAYKMGQSDSKTDSKEISLQKTVDSLKVLSANSIEKWSEIKQINEEKNKKIDQAIKSISQSKTVIKYEIIKNTQKINNLSDSAVQHFIDSIRSNGGFR